MQGASITLDQVLDSKIYIQEKSQISFGSPRAYIEPFLEKFEKQGIKAKYEVFVSDRTANKEVSTGKTNESFGRVLIQAKLSTEFTMHEHDSVIGLIYSLDTQKPLMRVFSGQEAWACTNLAIFGANHIESVEIMGGFSSIYDKALDYVNNITTQLARFSQIYQGLNDKIYEGGEIDRIMGNLLREGNRNKQLGTTAILASLKELDDNKSRYAIRDDKTSAWNIYSSLTQYVTDKVDIVEKANKTLMLSNLFVPII